MASELLDELEPVALGEVALEPEVDVEPVADPDPLTEPDPEVVVSVDERGVVVVVGGDADGVRSPGRSLTRSVRVSVHAVASVAIKASAESPASVRFMNVPPVVFTRGGPIPMSHVD